MSSTPRRKNAAELSRELAAVSGLPLREPQLEGAAGSLRSLLPPEFFQWFKCPVHGTWLRPEIHPFNHWQCAATGPAISFAMQVRCSYKRAAKMRTAIERAIFRTAKFLEENEP